MVLPWVRRERKKRQPKKNETSGDCSGGEIRVPGNFRCPISLELMKDPVTISTGITYDRESIERWFESGNEMCPVTNQMLQNSDGALLIPNHTIRKMIQDWCVEHRSFGIERVPTPRVPLAPRDVSEIRRRLEDGIAREDEVKCLDIVATIKNLGKESERNKKCLAQNGIVSVLSSCFGRFAAREEDAVLLEEVLSVIAWLLPCRPERFSEMGSTASLRCLVRFLNSTEPKARANAAFLVKEVVYSDESYVHALMDIKGAIEGLVELIRNPISPSSIKHSLMVIYRMVSPARAGDEIIARFLKIGLVTSISEMMVNAEKSISEKALGVLDVICDKEQGREEVMQNDLMVPLLVKKILRVSDWATRSSISILWKLGKKDKGAVMVEALQAGAFEKLLVVLQVGCADETREKASELLRSMNGRRNELERACVDSSMHFKNVKMSF